MNNIINIFSSFYVSETTYMIISFDLKTERWKLITDTMIIPWIYRSPWRKRLYIAFINNAECLNRFDGHPSTSENSWLVVGKSCTQTSWCFSCNKRRSCSIVMYFLVIATSVLFFKNGRTWRHSQIVIYDIFIFVKSFM